MTAKRRRALNLVAGMLLVSVFLIISTLAVAWASGVQFNLKTGTFEATAVIGIQAKLENVTVKLNSNIVGTATPLQLRNLQPGHYVLEISKPNFQTWHENYDLVAGQAGVVEDLNLIAVQPLISQSPNLKIVPIEPFDVGLAAVDGELLDRGKVITRLTSTPVQAHRFHDGYIYQTKNDLRYFSPLGTEDYSIYLAADSGIVPINLYPSGWQIAVSDNGQIKLINLTIPTAVAGDPSR